MIACPWGTGTPVAYTYFDDYYRKCTLGNTISNVVCPANPSYYAHNYSTYGSCVQYCPSGYYARDSTRSCSTTCPVYYYVNYTGIQTVRRCVASCPNNTFLDGSNCVNATSKDLTDVGCPAGNYGDPVSKACTTACTGTASIKLFADTNPNVKMCVYVCPIGYYAQTTPSRTCVTTCTASYIN